MSNRYLSRNYEDYSGLVSEEAKSPAKEQTEPQTKNGIVKGIPYLRLRKDPGESETTLKIVPEGTKLEILKTDNKFVPKGFIKVKIPEKEEVYWTREEYIK